MLDKRVELVNKRVHPTWQGATRVSKTRDGSSIRSQRKAALRKAAALRVKIETSVIKSRGLTGKHVKADKYASLMRHIPSAYQLAYDKNPHLWRTTIG